ncbi:hypothetical protein EI427_10725 [Flammeovirga pectinis]|uniref:YiaAB two helix domain-containing protein n=1 Tax=Flammeovirga pectinis TaxID=2494373 RepID=A0A3S9P3C0_9BACT|nr:inner membrane protein YiaA [Flammeovirga pectinis]AZQ62693.1 hypothetical protein EI427_10725 [Flammeovirga pectinis]
MNAKPSNAYVLASWIAMAAGVLGYLVGLFRAEMLLNEKGYYLVILLFALFSSISVQKCVRDKEEFIQVTNLYYSLSWFSLIISIVLLGVGLWNADLLPSEKGFYIFGFLLSLFGAVTIQKNTRDIQKYESS